MQGWAQWTGPASATPGMPESSTLPGRRAGGKKRLSWSLLWEIIPDEVVKKYVDGRQNYFGEGGFSVWLVVGQLAWPITWSAWLFLSSESTGEVREAKYLSAWQENGQKSMIKGGKWGMITQSKELWTGPTGNSVWRIGRQINFNQLEIIQFNRNWQGKHRCAKCFAIARSRFFLYWPWAESGI